MSDRDTSQTDAEAAKIRRDAAAKIQQIESAKARAEASAMTGQVKVGLLVTVVLMGVSWSTTFYEMWHRWFPAWKRVQQPVWDRLTGGDSYYSHGPLVPLTCLFLALYIYMRVGLPIKKTASSTWAGWTLLVGSLLLHLMSVYARVMFVSGFALIGVLSGLTLLWGGWTLARAYCLPVLFLGFMVPLPEVWIADLNFRLKFLAGSMALWATTNLFGVPAVMDGSYVYLEGGKTLVVENVCSGLRSMISLVWFASLFAMVCRARGLWRVVMLFMAVPVAIICNTIRITSLNVVAHYYSTQEAGPGGGFHDLSGLLIFALALAILFGIEQLIILTGRMLKREWSDRSLMGFLNKLRDVAPTTHAHHPVFRPMARPVVIMAGVAVLSVWWSGQSVAPNRGNQARESVPQEVVIDGQMYAGEDFPLGEQVLDILETNDYLYRRFSSERGRRSLDLLIVFSADNRKGTHPPDQCIEGGGNQIISKQQLRTHIKGMGDMALRELEAQQIHQRTYFLYVYKAGDRYTPSFFGQQFWIFVNGLTARNAAGALIRFSTPIHGEDIEAARQFTIAAANELLPQIDQKMR